MKKFAMILISGLFVLGCGSGHKRPGTCPHKKAGAKAAEQKPADKNATESMDFSEDTDSRDPAVTGYGHDPGEETQE